MKKNLVFLAIFMALNAQAEDAVPSPSDVPSDYIQQTDSALAEEARLDNKLKKLEKEVQILEKQKQISGLIPGINASSYGVPYVKAVEGIDRKYTALIIFGNGVEYESVAGDVLPNGMKVTRVAPSDVRVRSGKTEYRLGFINPSLLRNLQTGNQGAGAPGVPGF